MKNLKQHLYRINQNVSYILGYLLSILFVKKPRRTKGFAYVFCLDYQQNLSQYIQHVLVNSALLVTILLQIFLFPTQAHKNCSTSFDAIDCLDNFEFTSFIIDPTIGTEVLINWSTIYEADNSNLYLQCSKNGDVFTTFEIRNAVGSSQQDNSYVGIHVEPFDGVNYYRIKYLAPNGHTVYSRIKTVVFDNKLKDIIVFPNPVKDFVYVEILTDLTEDAIIQVVDMQRRIHSTQVVADGFRTYRIDMSDYPAGTYLIWVGYNQWRKDVQKVIKIQD